VDDDLPSNAECFKRPEIRVTEIPLDGSTDGGPGGPGLIREADLVSPAPAPAI
jgi:hypothetical protein